MPYEAYIGYLTNGTKDVRDEVKQGIPLVLEVRDTDTFERLVVKAIVSDAPAAFPESDELWVLDWVENRCASPWSIRVLEELSDEEETTGSRSDVTDADRASASEEARKYGGRKYRGAELPDSMGGEEAKKYYENVVGKRRSD